MIDCGRVNAILCAHIHKSRIILWRGTPVVVTTGLHTEMNPLWLPDTPVTSNDAAFALYAVSDDAISVNDVSLATDFQDRGYI